MTDKKNITIDNSWLDDLDIGNVEKSAKLNIIPSLKVELDETKIVKIIEMPKKTKFADNNIYFTMLLEMNGVKYQMNVNAKSFRFQLATLIKKNENTSMIGKTIAISKSKVKMKAYPNAELYSIQMIE